MDAYPTVLPRKWAHPSGPHGGPYQLPPVLLEKARRRLGAFALAVAVAILVAMVTVAVVTRLLADTAGHTSGWGPSFLFVTSLAMFGATRWSRLTHRQALDLGLLYEVLTAGAIALGFQYLHYVEPLEVAQFSMFLAFIVGFPLLVPTHPRKTAVVSVLAAATAPAALALLNAWGVAEVRPRHYFDVSLEPAVAVVLATILSWVVLGLNRDAARAQDLGSYRLESRLGAGGMGEVWVARHRLLARPAAVKLIRPDAMREGWDDVQRLQARFEREAQVTASLTSPHTVQLFDFGITDEGTFYYVMELLDAVDLQTLVQEDGPMTAARVTHVLAQVCASLEEAHRAGLVHRDVKPANILLCRYGLEHDFAMVVDFGLVALLGESDRNGAKLTHEAIVPGTPAYLAPEVARGEPADARSDLYALGCVAYWMLVGETVFAAPTAAAMVAAHLHETPAPPSSRTEMPVPEDLEALVMACLDKDPAARPPSASALANRLREIPLDKPWTQQQAQVWWNRHRPSANRRTL